MWIVYILECKDKSLYTGITKNMAVRLEAHKQGRGAKYTRSHKPKRILYIERKRTKSAALKREIEIQSWPRKKKLVFIGQYGFSTFEKSSSV
jgi:putative endonuclease